MTLRGHVAPVYQICWSSDSRMLISASKDSTLKIWDIKTKKIKFDLPGHLDEVEIIYIIYTVRVYVYVINVYISILNMLNFMISLDLRC